MSQISQLILRKFRCFEELYYEPVPGLNFITGSNAQGKTSVLEAACFLLRLRSPRTTNTEEMICFGGAGFGLEGTLGDARLSLTVAPSGRILRLDGVVQSTSSDYLSRGRIVWFGVADLALVSGPAEQRRKLLDSAGLQLAGSYARDLKDYDRSLRSRNLLLREGRTRREIEAYDKCLASSGDRIIDARAKLVERLAPMAAESCQAISGEELQISYLPGSAIPLLQALEESREDEIRLRHTRVGPHRDDVTISLDRIPAGSFASQGQCRTVALSLKLAVSKLLTIDHGSPPLLLLDDIFGELDPKRRDALLKGMPTGTQALLSTANFENVALPEGSQAHRLESGKLNPLF